jgi:hypothetical protein
MWVNSDPHSANILIITAKPSFSDNRILTGSTGNRPTDSGLLTLGLLLDCSIRQPARGVGTAAKKVAIQWRHEYKLSDVRVIFALHGYVRLIAKGQID